MKTYKDSDNTRLKVMPHCTRITINENMTEDDILEQLSKLYRFEFDSYFEVLNGMFIIQLWAGNIDCMFKTASFPREWLHRAIEYECFEVCIYDREIYLSNKKDPISICSDNRFQAFSWTYFFGLDFGDYVPMAVVLTIIRDCARVSSLAVFC